jgi:hypothetical protein
MLRVADVIGRARATREDTPGASHANSWIAAAMPRRVGSGAERQSSAGSLTTEAPSLDAERWRQKKQKAETRKQE